MRIPGREARSGSHPNSSCKYPNSFDLELAVIVATYVRQVIGAEEQRIAGLQLDDNFVLQRFRKNAGIPAMFQTPHS
jgi:hypothetical protein